LKLQVLTGCGESQTQRWSSHRLDLGLLGDIIQDTGIYINSDNRRCNASNNVLIRYLAEIRHGLRLSHYLRLKCILKLLLGARPPILQKVSLHAGLGLRIGACLLTIPIESRNDDQNNDHY